MATPAPILPLRDYQSIRHLVRGGDLWGFGGKGRLSRVVKIAQWRFPISHVGVAVQGRIVLDGETPEPGIVNSIIESTSLDGFTGVVMSRISDRIEAYDGDVWWFPLAESVRANADFPAMLDWLLKQEHKGYDFWQCFREGLREALRLNFIPMRESFTHIYCSELVTGAYKVSGIVPARVNASDTSPRELCRFRIYGRGYQLKGTPKPIPGWNSVYLDHRRLQ